MTLEQALQLRAGDEVFWTDPDGGAGSRHYTIATIDVQERDDASQEEASDAIVSITGQDGSVLECFAEELS